MKSFLNWATEILLRCKNAAFNDLDLYGDFVRVRGAKASRPPYGQKGLN